MPNVSVVLSPEELGCLIRLLDEVTWWTPLTGNLLDRLRDLREANEPDLSHPPSEPLPS